MQTYRMDISFERETEASRKIRQLARRTAGTITPKAIYETVPAYVLVTVDMHGIARELGRKAMENKSRIAREVGGLISVEWRKKVKTT